MQRGSERRGSRRQFRERVGDVGVEAEVEERRLDPPHRFPTDAHPADLFRLTPDVHPLHHKGLTSTLPVSMPMSLPIFLPMCATSRACLTASEAPVASTTLPVAQVRVGMTTGRRS